MAERQRTRRAAVDDRPPTARQRAADAPRRAPRRRRPVAEEPEPAADEVEVPEDEMEVPEDELEVADEEPEPVADEPGSAAEEDEEDEVTGEPAANGGRRARGRGDGALSARQATRAALRQIAELTAKQPEEITGVRRTDDGWAISLEVVEDHRIPSSADILATYEATIDAEGELTSYRRVRRYARGRGDSYEG